MIRDDVRQMRLIADAFRVSKATVLNVRLCPAYADGSGPPTRLSKGVVRETGWPASTPDGSFTIAKAAAQHDGIKRVSMYSRLRFRPIECHRQRDRA